MLSNNELVPAEIIENKILLLRGKKVILDKDLAELYGVFTKVLNQAVKRNIKRFPGDFMFQLNDKETHEVVTNCDRLKTLKYSPVNPYAFTEQGVAMLSSVLKSSRAVDVNIQIVRTFVKLREIMATHKDLQRKIEDMERKYNRKFGVVFEAIKQLLQNDDALSKRLTYEEKKENNKKWGFQPPVRNG